MLALILRGFILGLAIAAPVGPIGVLCIRRTLAQGRLFGFVSGLGAATADALYGCVAAFGLTAISALLVRQQDLLRLLGGLFLCYLGVRTLLARPTDQSAAAEGQGLGGAYFSTLLLTLTNPITILSFVAVFAGLGVGGGNGYGAAAAIGARRVPGLGGVVVPLERRRQPGAGQVRRAGDAVGEPGLGGDHPGVRVAALFSLLR